MSDREQDPRDEREEIIPEPDAPAAPGEEARAESFSRLVGGLLSGEPLPPAMDSDDRALLEAATVVVASTRELELESGRRDALIDEALERAVLGGRPQPSPVEPDDAAEAARAARAAERSDAEVVPIASRRSERLLRVLPWAVASVAAAAAILLFLTRTPDKTAGRKTGPRRQDYAEIHRSRPTDALVGMIREEDAARAGERLDTIFADRMAGYRDLYFRRKLGGSR